MKRFTTIIFFLALGMAYIMGQDLISIVGKSPYPEGTKVFFEGYEGFQKVDLGSIRTTANGDIDYFVSYHGYCLMSAESLPSIPLILEYDPTCIEWDSIPSFPCDQENGFYYKILPALASLDTAIIRFQASQDSLEKVSLWNSMGKAAEDIRGELMSGNSQYAGVLLEAQLLVLEAALLETTEDLAGHKAKITTFVETNYEVLYHSDALIGLAVAYTGMNKRFFQNPASMQQVQVYDVVEWLKLLGSKMGDREVIEFFLIHFAGEGASDIVFSLLEKYTDVVMCEQYVGANIRPPHMPYTFNVFSGPELKRVYPLDQFHGISKILAIYSPQCPASLAAVTALFGFMSENQIRMPVILVPESEMQGEQAELIKRHAPFGMQTGMKTGGGLITGAGVKQLPAFIMLDERNLLKGIYYDMKELQLELKGE
ncbi:MAG: hypothetical protein ABFS05_09200 [Bacteroidota bacterium]